MANYLPVPIFVSCAHYDLEDLRAELTAYLQELGVQPFVSSENGFPDQPRMPPYAQCLPVLEKCLIVIGVLDRRYGQPFDDWGPYPEYAGLSPTHAELRHALKLKKRVLVYVRAKLDGYYDLFRKNRDDFAKLQLPTGLDVRVLSLYEELKHGKPAPFIETFDDSRGIRESIRKRLLQDLYNALRQREELSAAGAEFIVERLLELNRPLLRKLATSLQIADQVTEYRADVAATPELVDLVKGGRRSARSGLPNEILKEAVALLLRTLPNLLP